MGWLDYSILLYALAMLGGGIAGFKMGHSLPSLITGIASFVLLAAGTGIARSNPKVGYTLAAIVVLGLVGVFVKRQMEAPSPRNIGLIGVSALMFVLLLVGHFMNQKGATSPADSVTHSE